MIQNNSQNSTIVNRNVLSHHSCQKKRNITVNILQLDFAILPCFFLLLWLEFLKRALRFWHYTYFQSCNLCLEAAFCPHITASCHQHHCKVQVFKEGHKKFTKSPTWFDIYLVRVKLNGIFHQIFVAFLENLNITASCHQQHCIFQGLPMEMIHRVWLKVFFDLSSQVNIDIWVVYGYPKIKFWLKIVNYWDIPS